MKRANPIRGVFRIVLKALMSDFALYLTIDKYEPHFYLPLTKFKNIL